MEKGRPSKYFYMNYYKINHHVYTVFDGILLTPSRLFELTLVDKTETIVPCYIVYHGQPIIMMGWDSVNYCGLSYCIHCPSSKCIYDQQRHKKDWQTWPFYRALVS